MKTARMIGNYAEHRVEDLCLSPQYVGEALQLSDREIMAFYKGRLLLTFEQLSTLAHILNTSVQELIEGNEQEYNSSVVHCMNEFDNESNREIILDIIDDYLDIWDSLPLVSK